MGAAFLVGHVIPFGSPVLWAMVIGAVCAPLGRHAVGVGKHARSMASHLLRVGIAVLGIRISVGDLGGLGAGGLLTAVGTVAGTMYLTTLLGRRMRVDQDLTRLFAAGTAICGASAIAAMATATRSRESNVGYSLATITLAGTVAMIVLPPIGEHLLHLDDRSLGIWLGASIHEIAQVAGAGAAVSFVALEFATLVKLARVVLLGPVVGLAAAAAPRHGPERVRRSPVPGFVVAFLILVAVRSLVDVPTAIVNVSTTVSTVLLAAGLGGLGLQIHVAELRNGGMRPLALGALSAVIAATISLLIVVLTSS
ncbi:MAG: putative sulfate exporter family transporter [Actinomycetota bacterium]|nr:putative sulfate exporter family transporter [Actinomycetota bacterium]